MRRDRDMHAVAILGSLSICAALVAVPLVAASAKPAEEGPNLAELEAIEASLAYKKPEAKPKQPQKVKQAPPDPVKPQGVSTDETKKPDPPKPEEEKKPPPKDLESEFERLRQQRAANEEAEYGKPTDEDVGAFDGSKFGYAEESKGDPYFQKLVGDLLEKFEFPEILQDAGEPVGCLRLSAEGKIQDTLFKQKSDNSELNDSVERALAAVQKVRNASPVPVPVHLLKAATTKWVCFKFQAKKRE
jgi:hypothetical protein